MTKKKTGPIKIGLVGLGRAGLGMHLKELKKKAQQRHFKIVAVCDPIKERREQVGQAYKCRAYRTVKELLKDPDVELVDITNRSLDHVKDAKLALKADKTVFLEKPISITYKGALQLKKAAASSRGRLYFRHNRRFEPLFQHVREILASGILGDVFQMRLCVMNYQRRDDWQTLKRFGGGQLLNWGPHLVDQALQLLDSPVVAIWSDLKKIAAAGDAEDHLKIVLKAKNDSVATIEISGGTAIGASQFAVWGTRGALESKGSAIRIKYLDPKKKLAKRKVNAGTPGMGGFGGPDKLDWIDKDIPVNPKLKVNMGSIWDYLYDSIRKGKKFPITTDEAVEVMRVISQARKGTKFESPKGLL